MIRKIFTVLIIAILIFSLIMLSMELWKGYKEENKFGKLREQVQVEESHIVIQVQKPSSETNEEVPSLKLRQYGEIAKLNDDFVGWIKIDNTNIDYPVVHTPSNEEYYLHRNFEKEYSSSGTPFISASNTLEDEGEQIMIYGHNMRNNTMFADLLQYKKQAFWRENPYIHFDTLTSEDTYEIFAVFEIDVDIENNHFPFYSYAEFENKEVYDDFLEEVTNLSLYYTGVNPSYGETIVSLITCDEYSGSNRMVVMGVKK